MKSRQAPVTRNLSRLAAGWLLAALAPTASVNAGTADDVAGGKIANAVGSTLGDDLSLGDRLENLGRVYNNKKNV